MKYSVTVSGAEPITLADAKAFLRTLPGDTSEDAAVITPLIKAAREYSENFTGCSFAQETIKAYPEKFMPLIKLPRGPVNSITSVKYTDKDGNEVTMDSNDYSSDDEKIAFDALPEVSGLSPIEITYTAGYASLPFSVRQAMLLLIGHWYQNREAVVVGAVTSAKVQLAVEALLRQWKAWWF